jgi:asparagine synthase (glutamine-hydrolysing)
MSGICGVLSASPAALADDALSGMLTSLNHRGPEGTTLYTNREAGIALGHLHLNAFAPSSQALAKGFAKRGPLAAAIDGTITNRAHLLRHLPPASPSELVNQDVRAALEAYSTLGTSWLSELDGPFCLALWDESRRQLTLSRDRFGEKSLYYCRVGGDTLLFASEIKAILAHPAARAELDPESLSLYFAFGYIPGPRTLFKGIHKLLPGESLQCEVGRAPSRQKYWRLPAIADGITDEQFCIRRLRELFIKGLEGYVNGSEEVAVFLSGGLDSSIIVAGLRELGVPRISTFTIGFSVDPSNTHIREDLGYARLVADAFSTDHHEVIVDSDHNPAPRLPHVIWQFDDLIMTPNIYSKSLLADAVRTAGLASVLTGSAAAGACGVHRKFLDAKKRERLLKKTQDCATDEERYYTLRSRLFDVDEQGQLFRESPRIGKQDVLAALGEYIQDIKSDDFFRLFLFSNLMITSTEKTLRVLDKVGMMASVEVRSPYLDRNLVEFSTQLPSSFDGGQTYASLKTHMKKAFEADLPRPVLERTVQGYPSYYWNNGHLRDYYDRLLSRDSLERDGIFKPDEVARILEEEKHSDAKSVGKLAWALMQFSLWHRIHIKRDPTFLAEPVVQGAPLD